jgi:radical SAM protein with 4Fe4S-binding SPASM domain
MNDSLLLKKVYNAVLNRIEMKLGCIKLKSLPPTIAIENTNRCLLNCKMCARRYWNKKMNPLGEMKKETFEKIIPYLDMIWHVWLGGFGEPLYSKNFFYIVKTCKEFNCKIGITTNGVLINKKISRFLIEHVDWITFSIDGATPNTYEKIRGVDFERVINKIQNLIRLKEMKRRKKPELRIEFIGMKDNIHELPLLIRLADGIGIKKIIVIHLFVYHKNLLNQSIWLHKELTTKYFKLAKKEAEKLGVKLDLPPLENTYIGCKIPFKHVYIKWDGEVRPCCSGTMIWEKGVKPLQIGNINDLPLEKIWNDEKFIRLRKGLMKNSWPPFCMKCPFRFCSKKNYIKIL